jgi:hypothetical protein
MSDRLELFPHAADRWARLAYLVTQAPNDLKTIGAWARYVGISAPALKERCRSVQARPKAALDFARVLRALMQARLRGRWDPDNLLDIVDHRTLARLLAQAGIPESVDPTAPRSIERFLAVQRFVANDLAITAIADLITRNN